MKKQLIIFLLMILFLSCAGVKPADDELLAEIKEQIADNSEQITEDNEQLAEDNEQLAENNEQVAEDNEQLAENNEQVAEDNEQVADDSEQLAVSNENGMKEALEEFFRQLFDPFVNREAPQIAETAPAEEQTPLVQVPLAQVPTPQVTPPPPQQAPPVQPQQMPPVPTPQVTPPTPQPRQPAPTPPAAARPPAPVQPPQTLQPVQQPETPTDTLLAEDESVTENEEAPPRRDFPNVPSARTESLAQRGAVPGENVNFSRVIRVTVGQILEIPFRGNGWVYLGELASRRGIAYNSRRTEPEGMSFVFNVEEAGTYALKFFREDFTRGYILNDFVQVIAGEAQQIGTGWFSPPNDRGRVIAQPRWPSATEEAEIRNSIAKDRPPPETNVFNPGSLPSSQTAQQVPASPQETSAAQEIPSAPGAAAAQSAVTPTAPAQGTTAAQTPPPAASAAQTPFAIVPPSEAVPFQAAPGTATPLSATPPAAVSERQEAVSPNMLLQRSKETFDGGNASSALSLLDQYMSYYPGGSDEAYWLYGQFYEANTPSRNILLSLDYYRRLVNEYPQSSRLADARRRIAYLERYYINIQ